MNLTRAGLNQKNVEEIGVQTRKLGNSGLQITPVGYGAWAIGCHNDDDDDSIAAIVNEIEEASTETAA